MTAQTFRHEVAFYEDADDYLATTIPFLREGLEAGEPALVAVGPAKTALLRGELGTDAERVRFENIEEFGRNPARIIPAWRDFVDDQERPGSGFRGIGEPVWLGRDSAEIDECQRHESLLNVAFGDGPGWALLCPYDSGALPDPVLAATLHSHPHIAGENGDGSPSPAWGENDCPDPFAGEVPARPGDAPEIRYDVAALHELRGFAARAAAEAGLSDQRAEDLIFAASELAANSVVHGGGSGCASAWRESGALLFETRDHGRIEEPLVGRVRPDPTQPKGRGLWMANQLCDLVQIRSSDAGTAVRLRVALD
ncbi:MAG: sensor histidine kinase [Thermoleophilia bacterium]|nr:sensor histidine kinase [Thermoleophilia bacterium]